MLKVQPAAPARPARREFRSGDVYTFAFDAWMAPGHPFSTDPRGGIFRRNRTFTIEKFGELVARNRGRHRQGPERIEFELVRVPPGPEEPPLVVKP